MWRLIMDKIKPNDTEKSRILLEAMRRGDEKAFKEFVRLFSGLCFSYFRRRLKSQETAQDLTQETFFSVYKMSGSLDGSKSLTALTMKICRNKFIDYLRAQKVDSNACIAPCYVPPIEDNIVNQEFIRNGLEILPPTQREVIELKYVGDLRCKDIAEILDLPEGTVKSHLYYARKKLLGFFQGGKHANV